MNILWFSNAPWTHTGYGNQTDLFWWRIQKLGHKVTLAANYGLAGATLNLEHDGELTKVLPFGYNSNGNDVLAFHAKYTKADIVITLYDAWVFDPKTMSQFRWCPWLPVDHVGVPDAVKAALSVAWQPIVYSRFALNAMKQAGIDALYVPHGVDTKVFRPLDKMEARKTLNLPRTDVDFLAVMVAANKGTPSRKCFAEVLFAWADFIKEHPKAMLFLHTTSGPQMSGLDLPQITHNLGLTGEHVVFCDPYWNVLGFPPEFMARLYNAADVLVNPSMGEGFGIPILEAQACGTPVIVGDWTSMPELCFAGWKVRGQPFWTPLGGWQMLPFIHDIRKYLERAYRASQSQEFSVMQRKAIGGAAAYDADRVTEEYWQPVLKTIERDLSVGLIAVGDTV